MVDRETLLRLRDAGLDEIRFDIGAVGYALRAATLAVGLIPTVTVEIPAVPEEAGRLKGLMAEMVDAGINHLNLHQMRLTPHNLIHLAGRPYTFLHGEKVTVLESELAALARQADIFRAASPAEDSWALSTARERRYFSAVLWRKVDFSSFRLLVGYDESTMREAVSYRNPFTEVKLATGKKVVFERWRSMTETELAREDIGRFSGLFLQGKGRTGKDDTGGYWADIHRCAIHSGGVAGILLGPGTRSHIPILHGLEQWWHFAG